MDSELNERIAFGRKLVETQIPVFCDLFGQVASEWKFDGSRVTEGDLLISNSAQSLIAESYPEDPFLSEELDPEAGPIDVGEGFSWLLDPIDGTNNFARGISACGIVLALLKAGEPVYGYTYDHSSRALFHGGPGFGLFAGDREVETAYETLSSQSIIGAQTSVSGQSAQDLATLQNVTKLRCLGTSAIHVAYAALGKLDGVIEHGIKPWDVGAGYAMIKAVGATFAYLDEPVFPLETFHPKMTAFGYMAGNPEMCALIKRTLNR